MAIWTAVYRGSFGMFRVEQAWDAGVPAQPSYWLDDKPISKEEADRLEEQWVVERHRRRNALLNAG